MNLLGIEITILATFSANGGWPVHSVRYRVRQELEGCLCDVVVSYGETFNPAMSHESRVLSNKQPDHHEENCLACMVAF